MRGRTSERLSSEGMAEGINKEGRQGLRRIVPSAVPLGLLFLAAIGLYILLPGSYYFILPLYIGLTFYLFCNVFRVGNAPEALWYLTFISITLITFHRPGLYALLIVTVCVPLQAGIILWRLKNPRRPQVIKAGESEKAEEVLEDEPEGAPAGEGESVIRFKAEDISCTGCATDMENILNEKDGIIEAKVNFSDGMISVRRDPAMIDDKQVYFEIRKLGFKTEIVKD